MSPTALPVTSGVGSPLVRPGPTREHAAVTSWERTAAVTSRAVLSAAVVTAALGVGLAVWLPSDGYQRVNVLLGLFYLAVPAAGAVMVRAQPRNLSGWTLLVGGTGFLLKNTLNVYASAAFDQHDTVLRGADWAAWVAQWGTLGQIAVVSVAVLLFPDGRLPGPRWRRVWPLAAVVLGGQLLAQGAPTFWHWDAANPAAVPLVGDALGAGAVVSLLLAPVLFTVCAAALRQRVRTEPPSDLRPGLVVVSRCAWLAAGAQWLCLLLGGGDLTPLVYVLERVAAVGLAAGAWYAIVRYRLFDLRLALNRTLVYLTLSAATAAGYVALVALARAVTGGSGWPVLAIALAALAALPLRDAVQRTVNRLVYGQAHDPYRALAAAGDQLAAVAAPELALPALCRSLARSLRLPYAAVEVDGVLVAECGQRDGGRRLVELPLLFAGEHVGLLTVRPASARLSLAEQSLLDRLTVQIGLAARAVSLREQLQRSRERVIALREEERVRIRRDLHDGLGPTLAGIVLGLEQARARVSADPAATATTLAMLSSHAQAAVGDIRRLVHDLRPPALDELGLQGALAEEARRLGVTPDADRELPPLPAAVEVALYRIGLEAMTNARRHAAAATVRLALRPGRLGDVELVVTDDGVGVRPGYRAGIGITSMRERAAELGGTCTVSPAVPTGTEVVARLPVPV